MGKSSRVARAGAGAAAAAQQSQLGELANHLVSRADEMLRAARTKVHLYAYSPHNRQLRLYRDANEK